MAEPAQELRADGPTPVDDDHEPVDAGGSQELIEEGAPSWTMTFGDMMSLLLTFFILLFSMSELEAEKVRVAVQSLKEGFEATGVGYMLTPPPPRTPVDPVPVQPVPTAVAVVPAETMLDDIADQLQRFVSENDLDGTIVVESTPEGVFLRIQDVALFQPGSATIEVESAWVVERLGELTQSIPVPVVISGHTDNVPIRTSQFPSNWELSAARAAGVARTLVSTGHGADAVRVEAFGEHRPIDVNETAEGRAANRRVELFYSRQNVEDALGVETVADTTGAVADSVAN